MKHPTQPEDSMMATVMLSVSEEASRSGAGVGLFHGYEFRAVRLGGRVGKDQPARVRVIVTQEGELIGTQDVDVLSLQH